MSAVPGTRGRCRDATQSVERIVLSGTGTSCSCCPDAPIRTFAGMATLAEPQPARRRRRRVTFLALLLLVFAAPAGYVVAVQPVEPYIVLFNDAAVTVPDGSAMAPVDATNSFLDAARPASWPAPVAQAVGGDTTGAARKVDGSRVNAHVRDIETRTGVSIDDVYSSAVGGFSASLTASQTVAIAADPAVAAIIPDEPVSLEDVDDSGLGGSIRTTSDPAGRVQPGIKRVGARTSQLEALTANGFDIDADVAIIDTGMQRNHPDLNVVGGYNCTSRDHTKWDDNNGHGTHVAGIVGALDNRIGVTGVAPGVRLWSVKVLDATGRGYLSWLVCGVDWVTAQRDKTNPSRPLFEVANMSLAFSMPGGDDSDCGKVNHDTLHMAICQSIARGTVYVAAAGNASKNAGRYRPAAYPEVITVSAMADYDGRGGGHGYPAESCPYWSPEPDDAFTSFSDYGPDVDLIAPGKCVLSTYIGSRYAWMSGTSMATPHVTGAVAVYRMLYPRATPAQVEMALVAVGTHDWLTRTDPDQFHEPALWIGQFREVPDFSVSASSTGTGTPGSMLDVNASLTRVGGFTAPIRVALDSAPSGFSATPVVTRDNSVTLTLRIGTSVAPGRYSITFSATSEGLEHSSSVTVVVAGKPPRAAFVSPRAALTVTSSTAVNVSWNESAGGAQITGRRLERQAAAIRTPGSCDNVSWSADVTRTNATETTDHVRSGYCYRWVLTLTDGAGNSSTAYSGAVLVDSSAPRAPSVDLAASAEYSPDLAKLGVDQAYVGSAGTLWVRAGASGSVPIQVSGSDPESGIARNVATIDGGSGWHVAWVGDSADGSLRLDYASSGGTAKLDVSSVNNAGLEGPSTLGTLLRDSTAPDAATWVSAPSDTTRQIHGTYFKLIWTGGSDIGSGLADQQIVARYVAPLTSNGSCKVNGFVSDGGFRLASDESWDSGLQPSSCYVWSLRTLDNVGNTSAAVVSGYVITLPDDS